MINLLSCNGTMQPALLTSWTKPWCDPNSKAGPRLQADRSIGRVPNQTSLLQLWGGDCSICSWNARALCHGIKQRSKANALEVLRLSQRFKVLVLLETHGTREQMEICFKCVMKPIR